MLSLPGHHHVSSQHCWHSTWHLQSCPNAHMSPREHLQDDGGNAMLPRKRHSQSLTPPFIRKFPRPWQQQHRCANVLSEGKVCDELEVRVSQGGGGMQGNACVSQSKGFTIWNMACRETGGRSLSGGGSVDSKLPSCTAANVALDHE